MTLLEKQSEFVELFNSLASWQEKFQYLIELGNELPPMAMNESLRNTQTRIIGCTSQTFFLPSVVQGTIFIQGWSNAAIPSGMIMMFVNIFGFCPVDELWEAKVLNQIDFHLKTDLINNLTEQRKAALLEILDRVIRL